jgi:predicted acetyltransferase
VPTEVFPVDDERFRVEMAESPAALAEIRDLYHRWAITQTGQMVRAERVWEHLLSSPDHAAALYRGAGGEPEGYALVVYRTDVPVGGRFLEVEEIAWLTPGARRGLLGWLGTLGDQWRQVVIRALPAHRLEDSLREPRLPLGSQSGWGLWFPSATVLRGPMFRLLDLRAAWSQRAVAPDAALTLALDVQDAQLADNAGAWRVRLEGGRALVERGAPSAGAELKLTLGIETLSRLFIGALPPSAAVRAGLAAVAGGAERLPDLDLALALPEPWTFDRF